MATDLPIPRFKSLAEVYPAPRVAAEGKRWSDLADKFQELYSSAPKHIVRAPGRVNILGEHVDYSLFPVLPAAVEQDMVVALRPREGNVVRVANTSSKFKPAEFKLQHNGKEWDAGLVPPSQGGGWENYLKVALLECAERYFPGGQQKSGLSGPAPVGMDVLITGNVPPGAGLSSSAAFVVSSVIVFLTANNLTKGVSKGDVVRLSIASEHRMGLRTGGMDQSASALSLAGSLLHLSFHPSLDAAPLPLPSGLAVVITNSLAPHALADSAPERYNLRVVEVLCASRLLLHAWGVDSPETTKAGEDGRIWLRQALDLLEKDSSEEEMFQHALDDLPRVLGGSHQEGWTADEMIAASGLAPEAFKETYLDFIPVRPPGGKFHLRERAEHTFTESLRVARFVNLCHSAAGSKAGDKDSVAAELGALLDASHVSLRDLYEATVPEVEELRDICKKHGALGSRQTGGGWGGAVISLVPVEQVPQFLESVTNEYKGFAGLSPEELEEAAFATLPGVGAGIYEVEDN